MTRHDLITFVKKHSSKDVQQKVETLELTNEHLNDIKKRYLEMAKKK